MFSIKMLPARFGDSFWLTYKKSGDETERRVLIDGGTAGTRNDIHTLIRALPENDRRIDLVVVTHIDNDHIAGVLTMLQRKEVAVEIGDIWFNGRKHLPSDLLGSKQGEQLSEAIEDGELLWNQAFGGEAAVLPDDGSLPAVNLPGGMKLTLISPTKDALKDLADVWDDELRRAGLLLTGPKLMDQDEKEAEGDDDGGDFLSTEVPDVEALADTKFEGDRSEANGSSIAFLAEFEGRRVLFGADAHVPQMLKAFERLSPSERLELDLFKVSHHGSQGTTSLELIEKLNCSRYAITTSGSNFGHPDQEAVARILKAGGNNLELIFNYRSSHNEVWDLEQLKDEFNYKATYPEEGRSGIEIVLDD